MHLQCTCLHPLTRDELHRFNRQHIAQMSSDKVAANVFWHHWADGLFWFCVEETPFQSCKPSVQATWSSDWIKSHQSKDLKSYSSSFFLSSFLRKCSELACLDGFYVVQGGRGGSDPVILKITVYMCAEYAHGCMFTCIQVCVTVYELMCIYVCEYTACI